MRSLFTGAACLGFALLSANAPLLAQSRDNAEPQLKCENQGYNNDRPRHCEVRELSLASIGRLGIDSGQIGGVTVKAGSAAMCWCALASRPRPRPKAPRPSSPAG